MFSSSVRRVARSSVTASTSACKSTSNSPLAVSAKPLACQGHQRRQSSSKTSCPPDGPRRAPQQSEAGSASTRSDADGEKRPLGRQARRKAAKEAAAESVTKTKDDAFSALPSVPSTQHLHPQDIAISSFFSLHRPISVTSAFPPSTTQESFDALFEPRKPKHPMMDTIYTLASAVETIEAASKSAEEKDLRFEILQQSPSNAEGAKHLDGAPRQMQIDMEALLKQFQPFNVPPPPVPFEDVEDEAVEEGQATQAEERSANAKESAQAQPRRKDYTTTIRITELIYPNGNRSISASASPIVRTTPLAPTSRTLPPTFFSSRVLPAPYAQRNVQIRQPFLERMRIRQQKWEEAQDERGDREGEVVRRRMYAISVKRQRKLKMKKHKYKKLMKKTRTLRRRLDRT